MNGEYIPFDPTKETPEKKEGVSYHDQYCGILNNFHLHFPYGEAGEVTYPEGYYRALSRKHQGWDKKRDQGKAAEMLGEVRNDTWYYSKKKVDKSPQEFYAEIDEVLAELGISMSSISDVLYKTQIEVVDDDAVWELKWKLLSKVYTTLRLRGYNKRDLCG